VRKGKDKDIPKQIFTIKSATAKANDIEMVGNTLAYYTAKDTTKYSPEDLPYKVPFFPYNRFFWNYNARAVKGENMHKFQENVPYKVHPWVDNIEIFGSAVQFDFSSDVAAASPCAVITVDASQCTNLKAIYAKDGSPKFVNRDKQYGNDALGFTLDDVTLYQPGDLSPQDAKTWPYSLKVTISGIRSFWHNFPLEGNNGKPSYWYLDRDGNGKIDVFEGNSDKFPQTEGNFTVWIACAPRRSACCIPYSPKEEGNFSTCEDLTAQDCALRGGTFHDGTNCFTYPTPYNYSDSFNYYGTPGPDGQVKGMCPAHCPQQPRSFKYALDWSHPSCDGEPTTGHHEARIVSAYHFAGPGMACAGSFGAGPGGGFMFGKIYTCSSPARNYASEGDNYITGPYEPDPPTQLCSSSGGMGCDGGTLTQTCPTCNDGTSTKTITVSAPQCGGSTYAAQDNRGNIKCCKLNEWFDKDLGVCKPVYTSQYCSPTPSPTPTLSPSPSSSALQ
jgi:hypothetical protein